MFMFIYKTKSQEMAKNQLNYVSFGSLQSLGLEAAVPGWGKENCQVSAQFLDNGNLSLKVVLAGKTYNKEFDRANIEKLLRHIKEIEGTAPFTIPSPIDIQVTHGKIPAVCLAYGKGVILLELMPAKPPASDRTLGIWYRSFTLADGQQLSKESVHLADTGTVFIASSEHVGMLNPEKYYVYTYEDWIKLLGREPEKVPTYVNETFSKQSILFKNGGDPNNYLQEFENQQIDVAYLAKGANSNVPWKIEAIDTRKFPSVPASPSASPDQTLCELHMKKFQVEETSAKVQSEPEKLVIYPNPFRASDNGEVNLKIDKSIEKATIMVHSMDGRQVMAAQEFLPDGSGKISFKLRENLAPGNYLVTLWPDGSEKQSVKLIVQK